MRTKIEEISRVIIIFTVLTLIVSCNNVSSKIENSNKQEDNHELINRYFAYINNHNWEKMAKMYSETVDYKDPYVGINTVIKTRDEIYQSNLKMSEAIPDYSIKVNQIYISGDNHIISEFTASGTLPDSTKFELPICCIHTIEDGKITADFTYYNVLKN